MSVNVAAAPPSGGWVGLANAGFWGIDVRVQKYTGSFYVRGAYNGSFTASLRSVIAGDVFASVEVASRSVAHEWVQHNFTLVPTRPAPSSNNTFSITFDAAVCPLRCLPTSADGRFEAET